ncbi:MAG TPA: YihY/virulence factor BrkB family protein [Gaiellaceae bacterium]|nr:YihY/virulence factor BrkB family protein [Gaiellaceae bacterium]
MSTWRGILVRAGKRLLADNGTMLASALAYSAFFAIPAVLLVVVGVFTLAVGAGTIDSVMHRFHAVLPSQATSLLGSSLHRLDAHPAQSVLVTVFGFVLAVWSTTGAMTSYMTAINLANGQKDTRKFVHRRIIALKMVAVIGVAFVLVAVLLMFGPAVEHFVASHAGSASGAVGWIWWIAQWPILIGGLLVAFATLLYLGPAEKPPRLRLVTPGAMVAAAIWLLASGAFAVYSSKFGSYNKTWGSLSAVIVMLTWLWLGALALLYGAEVDAEFERAEGVTAPTRDRRTSPLRRRLPGPRRRADRSARP